MSGVPDYINSRGTTEHFWHLTYFDLHLMYSIPFRHTCKHEYIHIDHPPKETGEEEAFEE